MLVGARDSRLLACYIILLVVMHAQIYIYIYSYERTSVYFYYYYCICIQTKAYKKTGGPKNSGVRVIYSHTVRE